MRGMLFWLMVAALGGAPLEAATYYVRKTGNDGNSGATPAQAWQTIDEAADNLVAGDIVYVGAGTYNEEVTPSNDGTAANPIRYVADTTGAHTGDAGPVIISSGTNEVFDIDGDSYQRLTGFRITGGTARAVRVHNSVGIVIEDCEIYSSPADGIYFDDAVCTLDRCIVRNCTDFGVQLARSSTVTMNDCQVYSNSLGVFTDGPGVRALNMSRCVVRNNGGRGCYFDGGTHTLENCLVRNNTSDGIWTLSGTTIVWHSTVVYNQGAAYRHNGGMGTLRNSIFAFNSQQGLVFTAGTLTHTHNCVSSNSWGNYWGTLQSTGETTANPRFWSATCFELADGSPCINTGTNPGGAVTDDIEQVARPSGGGYDMGCYETVVLNYASLEDAYTALDPYAWWRLNESSGSTASDQKGNHHGTYQNGVVLDEMGGPFGGFNKAAKFDGVDDKVHLGTINPTVSTMSFVAWLKADDFDVTNADILAKTSGGLDANYFWSLGTVNSGGQQRLRFRFRAGGATASTTATFGNLSTDSWVFVAGVYDGQAIIVYKDGIEVGRTTLSGTPDLSAAVSAAIGDSPVGSRPFAGCLDEVAIFTRMLKPREIAAIYASALKGSVQAGVVPQLWGIDEDDSQLFSVTNYNNFAATLTTYGTLKWDNGGTLVDLTNVIDSLAIHRYGRMYMISEASLGTYAAPVLLSFDLNNASTTQPNVVTIVGSVPTLPELRGLAFDPSNDDLYALRHDGWLFVISTTDASIVRTVGQISGFGDVVTTGEDLVFDPFGNLHVMDDTDDEFYRVNKSNAAILDGFGAGSIGTVQGMAWDYVNNRILTAETGSDFIINAAANLSSASYVFGLGAMGLTDVEAIGFVPSEGRAGVWPTGVRVLKWKEIR